MEASDLPCDISQATKAEPVYYWCKFYEQAQWQIVKMYMENGEPMVEGFDWASRGRLENFTIAQFGNMIDSCPIC